MKTLKLILLSYAILLSTSCESEKIKKDSAAASKEFFKHLKNGNEEKLAEMYPGFADFDTYFKSDSAFIKATEYEDDVAIVSVQNSFTNGLGKQNGQDILLFFKKDSLDELQLIDSKGLTDFKEINEYKFGKKTGCISALDTTDQQIIKALKKTKLVFNDKAIEVYLQLKRDVKVIDWNWETLYSGSATGKGIVINNSGFSIPTIKYTVSFKNRAGDVITTDKGIISYETLNAGESTSFTFYSEYVGNANSASIELNFDDNLIYNYLAANDWTGKECQDYFEANPHINKDGD